MKKLTGRDFLTILFILLGSLILVKSVWNGINDLGISDFSTYYYTAKGVFAPRPEHPYVNIVPFYPFFYPPQSLLLFRLFTLIPFAPAKALWAMANGLFAVGFVFLLTKIFGKSHKLSHLDNAVIFLLTTVFFPLQNTISGGQINVFLLFLTTAAFYFFQQKRDGLTGILLGIATVIKISPFLLLLYFLLKRQWKISVSGLATMGGLTLLTELFVKRGIHWYYLRHVVDDISKQSKGGFRDQSLRNFLTQFPPLNKQVSTILEKIPQRPNFLDHEMLINLVSWGIIFAVITFLAYICRKKITDRRATSIVLEYNLFLTIAVVGTGLTWFHQYAMLLLPLLTSFVILAKSKAREHNYLAFLAVSFSYLVTAIPWENWELWGRFGGLWPFGMLGGIFLNFIILLALRLRWIKT